jgi:hypothetical protein
MYLTTCIPYPIGKQPRKARETYENAGGTQDLAVTGFESRILSSPLSIDHLPIEPYGVDTKRCPSHGLALPTLSP